MNYFLSVVYWGQTKRLAFPTKLSMALISNCSFSTLLAPLDLNLALIVSMKYKNTIIFTERRIRHAQNENSKAKQTCIDQRDL
jgi:hypothetical protein